MSISIQRMSDAIGARLTGIDLRSGIDDAVMKEVHQAWLENFVIVIPGQDLSGDDQIAFTEWFGPRQEVRTVKVVDEGPQNFMYVANKKFDGMESVLPEGEMQFHTDQCYYETPSRATILFAIEIPAEGGNTKFANAYRAYESLDDAMKSRLQGLKALNVYDYDANSTIKRYESSPDAPRYAHPGCHPSPGNRPRGAVYQPPDVGPYCRHGPRRERCPARRAVPGAGRPRPLL